MNTKICPDCKKNPCDVKAKRCWNCHTERGHSQRGHTNRKCRNHSVCGNICGKGNLSGFCRSCFDKEKEATKPGALVNHDKQLASLRSDLGALRAKYDQSLKDNAALEARLGLADAIALGVDSFEIKPSYGTNTSEGTVVVAASDWHVEEIVRKNAVNGVNEYNPEIAKARAVKFFQGALRLTQLLQQDIKVNSMVLALLGDFITNQLHEESAENNAMMPTEATRFAESLLISGIEFLLEHSKLDLVMPCHSGNHARTTRKVHVASEHGHSLEWLMYHALAEKFASEKRCRFIVPEGYHSYVDVYDQTIRFHHGHNIQYSGGVGGIFISANKAVKGWNDTRWADLDVFGHHHHSRDGAVFLSNGSLIGYNSFAIKIKAPFEKPKQQLFLLDKKRGRTATWPILVE